MVVNMSPLGWVIATGVGLWCLHVVFVIWRDYRKERRIHQRFMEKLIEREREETERETALDA